MQNFKHFINFTGLWTRYHISVCHTDQLYISAVSTPAWVYILLYIYIYIIIKFCILYYVHVHCTLYTVHTVQCMYCEFCHSTLCVSESPSSLCVYSHVMWHKKLFDWTLWRLICKL